jgi:hypothetical protein
MKDVEYMFIVDDAIVDAVAKFGEIQGVSIKDVAATVRAALGRKQLTLQDYQVMLSLLIAETAHNLFYQREERN